MDPVTILAAIAPLGVDVVKALIGKFLGQDPNSFKPANIGEWTSIQEMQLKLFEAMNNAGGSNASYPWVEAIVRLQRPFVVAITILTWAYAMVTKTDIPALNNFCAAVGFYLFGDRTLFYTKQAIASKKMVIQ